MNKVYKVVRNRKTGIWEAVAETARSHGFGKASVANLAIAAGLLAAVPVAAQAACTTSGTVVDCVSGVSTDAIGTGLTSSVTKVTVESGATVSTTNTNAISVGNNVTIDISGTVMNNASTGGINGTGPNTIEFGRGVTLTVEKGASVTAIGSATNGEAINPRGNGNTITNYGTISTNSAAALYFENTDTTSSAANVIDNYGTIRAGSDGTGTIVGNAGNAVINFTNESGAEIDGSLSLGSGADTVTLYNGSIYKSSTSSTVSNSGTISGGGGSNTLVLTGNSGSDALGNAVTSFSKLNKQGTGTWTVANTLGNIGVTALDASAGTLILTSDNAGYAGTTTIDGGGTLQLGAGSTTGSLGGNVTDNGTLAFNRSDALAVSGAISGTGAVTQIGNGTTTLSGTNTYSGATTVSAGTLKAGSTSAFGSNSATTVNAGSTLDLAGYSNSIGSLAGAGTVTNSGSSAATLTAGSDNTSTIFSGQIQDGTGVTGFTKTGSGTLTLTGANTYSGGTDIEQGALAVTEGGSISNTENIHIDGSLSVSGAGSSVKTTGNPGQLIVGYSGNSDAALSVSDQGTVSVNGTLSTGWAAGSAATTTIDGSGSSATSYIGIVGEYGTGTLQVTNGGQFTVLSNGGSSTGNFAAGDSVGGSGTVEVNGAGSKLTTAKDFYVNADGLGNVSVTDGGTIAVGGIMSFGDGCTTTSCSATTTRGVFNLGSGGTLQVGGTNGIVANEGNGSYEFNLAGGTLQVTNASLTTAVDMTTAAGTSSTVDTNGLDATLSGIISGQGALAKAGSGTLTLAGNNSYSGGTTISAGTVIGTVTSFGTGAIADNAALVLDQSTDGSLDNTISGSGTVTKQGSGNVTLSAANTYAGGTIISAGTLTGTTSSFGTGAIADNAALVLDQSTDGSLDNTISGSGTVTKQGSGNVTLSAANTYTGGTKLAEGQLSLGNNSALGTGRLTMADGTTLGFVTDGLSVGNDILLSGTGDPTIDTGSFTETLTGAITGTGELTKTGSGTLITTGANTYSGASTVAEGTLQAGAADTLSANSAYTVAAGATLALAGYDQTVAALSNAGTVSFHSSGSTATSTTLTVAGNYVGNGGTIAMNTVLGDDSSATDKLVVTGNASGNTTLAVTNAGGLGAKTTRGIELVDVGGTSTSDAFSLSGGHVDAGAYEYRLFKGAADGTDTESWYLESADTRKEVPLYSALPAQLRQADATLLGDLHKRMGETPSDPDRLGWARVIASNTQISQAGSAEASTNGHFTGLQVGSDFWRGSGWRVGAYAGYLHGSLDVSGLASGVVGTVGSTSTDSYFIGAYGTHTWNDGSYLDLVLQGAHHKADLSPEGGNAASSMSGKGLTASAEAGKPFAIGASGWAIEPQAQVMHQWLNLNDAQISGATTVSQGHDSAWIFRLGARLKGDFATRAGHLQPYARVNFYYSPSGSDRTTFATDAASTTFSSGAGFTSTELAAGATLDLAKNVKAYGEIGHVWSNGGDARLSSSIQGSLGVRVSW